MFQWILNFVMELGMLYLLTALFVILDLMLLSARARRLRGEKTERNEREERREAEALEQRKAFERRHAHVPVAP
jgi:cell division protein ZapA (FtsZ GTPase activity inhibitor)